MNSSNVQLKTIKITLYYLRIMLRYTSTLDTILLIILEEYSLSRGIEDDITELCIIEKSLDIMFPISNVFILILIISMYHKLY